MGKERQDPDLKHLKCDVCESTNIRNDNGFVCVDCGNVLSEPVLQFDSPYNQELKQHQVLTLGKSEIGTPSERANNYDLKRLHNLNRVVKYGKMRAFRARAEITRIFASLNIPNEKTEIAFRTYKAIDKGIPERRKLKNPDKSVPLAILDLRKYGIFVDERELLKVAKLSSKELKDGKMEISLILGNYAQRDRRLVVSQIIYKTSEELKLGTGFCVKAMALLDRYWDIVKDTTDKVLAGLVATVTLFCGDCMNDESNLTIHRVCNTIGTTMSSNQKQAKKLLERLGVKGFTTLVQSRELIKSTFEKDTNIF